MTSQFDKRLRNLESRANPSLGPCLIFMDAEKETVEEAVARAKTEDRLAPGQASILISWMRP